VRKRFGRGIMPPQPRIKASRFIERQYTGRGPLIPVRTPDAVNAGRNASKLNLAEKPDASKLKT
jgi:hypothetical protein